MRAHMRDHHGNTPRDKQDLISNFRFKVVKRHTYALNRQVHESVAIKRTEGVLMNSKTEYNRCTLPTLETNRRQRKNEPQREPVEETETDVEAEADKRKPEETE